MRAWFLDVNRFSTGQIEKAREINGDEGDDKAWCFKHSPRSTTQHSLLDTILPLNDLSFQRTIPISTCFPDLWSYPLRQAHSRSSFRATALFSSLAIPVTVCVVLILRRVHRGHVAVHHCICVR